MLFRSGARIDVQSDLGRLLSAARPLLAPGAWLLLLCASRRVDPLAAAAAAGFGAPFFEAPGEPDFTPLPDSPPLRVMAFAAAESPHV